MRSLIEFVQELRDGAEIMMDLARQVEEVAQFFGGAARPAPKPQQEPQQRPAPVTTSLVPPAAANGYAEELPDTGLTKAGKIDRRTRAYKDTQPTPEVRRRRLTPAEKDSIRRDYESLPPALRTRVNRAALAAKYQCSPQQIAALLSWETPEHMAQRMEKVRAAKQQSR